MQYNTFDVQLLRSVDMYRGEALYIFDCKSSIKILVSKTVVSIHIHVYFKVVNLYTAP